MPLLNDDVLQNICRLLEPRMLYRACLVCRQWRHHAQGLLYKFVIIELDLKSPPGVHHDILLKQKTYLFSRTMTHSPHLAASLTALTYVEPQMIPRADTRDMLRGILLAATKLNSLLFVPTQGKDVGPDADIYRRMFQEASFSELHIETLSLHHVCMVPARSLEYVEIRELARDKVFEFPAVRCNLDLSELRITSRYFVLRGFAEAQPLGIGANMWTLSTFLENCVVAPELFCLHITVISRKTVQAPLLAFGTNVRHLLISPQLPKRELDGWSLPHPEHEDVLGGIDISWPTTTPNLKQLTTSVLFPSLHSLTTLHTLTIACKPGMGHIPNLVELLEDVNFSPGLRYLKFSHAIYHYFVDDKPGSLGYYLTSLMLKQLLAACKRRQLEIEPFEFGERAMAILAARKYIEDSASILEMHREELDDSDED